MVGLGTPSHFQPKHSVINKVDYFGYTFDLSDADRVLWSPGRFAAMLLHECPPYLVNLPGAWELAPNRASFQMGMSIGKHTFMWVNSRSMVLVEHTGQGCEILQECDMLTTVMSEHAHRATRVDVASDILTQAMPADFVAQVGKLSATSASGHQHSKSGQTFYVGSRKSDRTCKVYRYFPPHPRAEFLRIEYTYKRQQAKIVAGLLAAGHSPDDIALASGQRYGWQHSCYQPASRTDLEIAAWRPERRQGKTVAWLYAQCVPAVARLAREGVLDLDEFIQQLREKTDGTHTITASAD